MNLFLKTFLRTGIFFGACMGLYYAYAHGLKFGIVSGIASGSLFGAIMASFTYFQSKKFQSERPMFSDEKLIKEGPANHLLNIEGVGGWIYLTDKNLLFNSHSINVQNHELSIPLSEIADAEKGRTLGIIPNQLRIKLKNEKVEKFAVNDVNDWIKNIQELR
ncbi:MAG: GRAM domain-containing protein [Pyrinomonadaceae bacterium]